MKRRVSRLFGPGSIPPEMQWHRGIIEFAADAVISTPEFEGVTIVQPTDSGPALPECRGVIWRFDPLLASNMLTVGQEIALIARLH